MIQRNTIREIFHEALLSVLPETLIRESVRREGGLIKIASEESYNLSDYGGVYVFGSGKASVEMARAMERILGSRLSGGLVVSHAAEKPLELVETFISSHPVPTEKSVEAADLLVSRLAELSEDDFFFYLMSGGSSALVEKPHPPVDLSDAREIGRELLGCGMTIEDMNVVRKHLSLVKGGRLGRVAKARGVVLVLSDVIGDDLEAIGSALLYCDRSTYKDAYHLLLRYNLWDRIPSRAQTLIRKGISGDTEDTPKKPNPRLSHVVIGNGLVALKRARAKAQSMGMSAHIMTSRLRGEAQEVAKFIVSLGEEIARTGNPFSPPVCLLFGGETTVTLTGNGKGGRNQEMCLAALRELRDNKSMILLCAGTDGMDGNSDAAGAVVDHESYARACRLGLDLSDYLNRNDSHSFFTHTGDLVLTGPTGTNVMDIGILLIRKEE